MANRKAWRENLKRFSNIPTVGGVNQLQAVFSFGIAGAVVTVCMRLGVLIRDAP